MKFVFLKIVGIYRLFISPFLGGHCRFYPSCSRYAEEAFRRHRLWNALVLSVSRLLRCHPWHSGGIDIVP